MPTLPRTKAEESAKSITGSPTGYVWRPSYRWRFDGNSASTLAITIWSLVLLVVLLRAGLQPERSTVYPIFANAARGWQQGVDVYDSSISRGGLDRFRYAPIVAVVMTPLAMLPDSVGGVIWRILNAFVFFVGFVAFARDVYPGRVNLRPTDAGWLALLSLPLTVGSLNNGQPNLLIVGCLLLGVTALAHGRLNLAGVYLTVPILFKVYPIAVVALLVLVRPRLSWRVLVGVAVGCLIPFALQEPGFVARCYASWFEQVGSDNRHLLPLELAYRDFHALLRQFGWQLGEGQYLILQLLAALLTAGIALRERWRRLPTNSNLRAAFDLGCCWMVVFGPATENNTFALLAPTVAFAVRESFQPGQPRWQRCMTAAALAIFVVVGLAIMTPFGKTMSVALMPLGGALVFVERVMSHAGLAARWIPVGQRV